LRDQYVLIYLAIDIKIANAASGCNAGFEKSFFDLVENGWWREYFSRMAGAGPCTHDHLKI